MPWRVGLVNWNTALCTVAFLPGSVGELKKAIRRFNQTHDDRLAKLFRWHKSAESIMTSVTRAKLSVIDYK